MSTLKEAAESGRRYRYNSGHLQGGFRTGWYGPGLGPCSSSERMWTTEEAISNLFEIEIELEKPKRYVMHEGSSRFWHSGSCYETCSPRPIYVHDADACNRLQGKA